MSYEPTSPPAQKGDPVQSNYLHPYACFRCRKSFKRGSRKAVILPCPECGGPSIGLTRKFKPPKQSDGKQWEKVEALVRHGFLFWSLDEPYPDSLREVPGFVERHAKFIARARAQHPEAYRQIETALSLAREG
jgi:predicted  nucleic acid-binding Zn-ribbon protein